VTTSQAIAKRVSRSTARGHSRPREWHASGQASPACLRGELAVILLPSLGAGFLVAHDLSEHVPV
jgi:hypothetical protein